jgi:rhodanese-related sulfurtransferase
MKHISKLIMICAIFLVGCFNRSDAQVKNPKYQSRLQFLLSHNVAEITVQEAKKLEKAIFLDTREKEEHNVSHIKDAVWVGYDDFDISRVKNLDKSKTIVIYCSVGYRSEKVTKQLEKAGFKKVFNMYGGLFEWYNEGYPMVDNDGKTTTRIHTYNKKWSKWVEARKAEDVTY